jgi:hypothetical protein
MDLNEVRAAKKRSERKLRTCMFKDCTEKAIKSHVLQKNGILREISEDNHLIQLMSPSPYEMDEKGISDFKRVGINEVYTFDGFCNAHDTEVFKPIETDPELNFELKEQQILFFYRGLCQEIRRKEIGIELIGDIRKLFPPGMIHIVDSMRDGFNDGLRNLNYFKGELETSIETKNFDNFIAETIKIPRIELCISGSLNIGDLIVPENTDYESWRANKQIPFTTSFINIFPKSTNSYAICGYHVDYPCLWTRQFVNDLKSFNKEQIFKQLSDLVALRLEFWTMSQGLFRKIEQDKLDKYKNLFMENIFNHSPRLTTDLNLFESI